MKTSFIRHSKQHSIPSLHSSTQSYLPKNPLLNLNFKMKTSFISLFALAGLFASSIVASPLSTVAVEKRQSDAALSIVTGLLTTIQGFDATINSTTAGISSDSTDDEKAAASTTVNSQVSSITDAINSAIVSVQAIPTTTKRGDLAVRQSASPTAIALAIESILLDLSGTLNGVIASLGLTSLLGFLTPLTTALSGLIAALEVVVDDLLAVVEELLNGILTGLIIALAGLVL